MATLAIDRDEMLGAPPETRIEKTYCRICMVTCGLSVEIEGDTLVKVKGDFSHPLTKGYTCPKGRSTHLVRHRPDTSNITEPLMRKNGELVPVSWDEALDDIAVKLRRIIDEHGPHSIGMYFGSGFGIDSAGYDMMDAFYNALGTPPKFTPLTNDGTAKVMLAGAMMGTHALNPKTDYDNCKLLIYIGTNPMVSHAHNTGMFNPAQWIKAAAKRGEVWTLDPVATETAKLSTRHIAPYPGKDYAMLAWIVKELIDHGPMQPKQALQDLDELRANLEGLTRAMAAEISGVSEQDCQDLLDAIRRHPICSIETGTGITMSAGCNMTQFFSWVIMAITGSMNAVGGAWFHPGFLNKFEEIELPIMETAFTPGPSSRPEAKGILGDWPCAVLPTEIRNGTIKALFNFGGHIMRSFPDTNALEETLPTLELNVNTEIAHNDTTALCTHVLPPKYGMERHEFTRWDTLPWNVSLQYSPPLVPPMGNRRSGWWMVAEFMKRAGLPVPDHLPESDLVPGADEHMLRHLMRNARCTFEELQEKRYVEFPYEFPAQWVEDHFVRLGGWRLAVPEIMDQWRTMRAQDEANLGRPKPLVYSSRRQRKKMNGQLDFLGAPQDILINPETAEERGIVDGMRVRIYNKSGEIYMTAKVDPEMRRGVGSIPHGHFEANVNRLTSEDDYDPLGGMALYSGVLIEVEPAREPDVRNWAVAAE